ncbi:transcriptional regulator [Methylacidiphilum kamchatkense Kam1]|uniref:Transcriptional regulator n=1 Tax=Methylacidiphilum kamchatkense Kam1 TaxID=1202785 RepID=A0A0C1RWW9_9BACT|nr:sigma-54-dependent Fis family transcriptional regulator [Methylacidiphilum kamchatkense]KIE59421.1 transcriptional regulator [Methylacidiphilum kamchatkense Kam1]QDQ42592.1 transcriptional regulator of acetoin/glycerol metabolism [Methylacidiphilum kamchatkense Kam1]
MTDIIQEWERFTLGNATHPRVRDEILKSWERCKKYGIDREKHSPVLLSSKEEKLNLELDSFSFLQPLFPLLRMQALDFDCLIAIVNSEGVVTFVDGPERLLEKANFYKLVIGANWSEKYCGCSAIGAAIEEKKPISVIGPEHYCASLHDIWCTSAIIHKPESKDLFMALTMIGDIAHKPIPISIAITNSSLIETKLTAILYTDRVYLYNKFVEKKGFYSTFPFLLIDSLGTILHCPKEILAEFQATKMDFVSIRNRPRISIDQPQVFESDIVLGKMVVPALIEPIVRENRIIGYIIELSNSYVSAPAGSESLNFSCFLFKSQKSSSETTVSHSPDLIIGKSPAFVAAMEEAKIAAQNDLPVLLLGETGTGKEIFAKFIHQNSRRAKETFLAINCAAIPKELVVSELFGFEGGTFTGSSKEGRKGKFLLANNGSIFLDEIGELPLEIQGTLLRVLEEFEIFPIGAKSPIPVDVRVIAATNKDLKLLSTQGAFRQDLFYRLNIFPIHLPPLRERDKDIELLFIYFIEQISAKLKFYPSIDWDEILPILYNYSWPGNVRELKNVAFRLIAKNLQSKVIKPADLLSILHNARKENEEGQLLDKQVLNGTNSSGEATPLHFKKYKKELFFSALEKTGGNASRAAKLLGVHRSTLYRNLKKFHS